MTTTTTNDDDDNVNDNDDDDSTIRRSDDSTIRRSVHCADYLLLHSFGGRYGGVAVTVSLRACLSAFVGPCLITAVSDHRLFDHRLVLRLLACLLACLLAAPVLLLVGAWVHDA